MSVVNELQEGALQLGQNGCLVARGVVAFSGSSETLDIPVNMRAITSIQLTPLGASTVVFGPVMVAGTPLLVTDGKITINQVYDGVTNLPVSVFITGF